ncbi:MAG: DUF1634 domain-containing protein [Burkholderiaceae bacterium]|nr:DUF1634 domain-containing protein [Burkholderiaceae bacterium]
MHKELIGHPRLERMLGHVLHYGTWLSCGVIALGLTLMVANGDVQGVQGLSSGKHIITAGVALLILLPVLRVGLMLMVFLQERDYRYVLIAAFVLVIILMGFLLGLYSAAPISA